MRRRLLTAFAAVALPASCATRVWLWGTATPAPLPNLVAGLRNPLQVGGNDFEKRLHERFPIGSPEFDLIRELWVEGFSPATGPQSTRTALWSGDSMVCELNARVNWAADDSGHLITLSGNYYETCL
jgi:hypothetical protein